MDIVPGNTLLPGDPRLIDHIVCELKSQGIFDQFRKECIADVDTKPAYQNLRQRVEGSVTGFLKTQTWRQDMNKNQLREALRKNIYESGFLETGVERIVDQVVNPKINAVFLPQVEDVVYKFLGLEKPTRNCSYKNINGPLSINTLDLLPTDLDPISPDTEILDKALNKSDKSNDNTNLDDSKLDDFESPPFEPITDQNDFMQIDDSSNESKISGISGLTSHDSNFSEKDVKVTAPDVTNPDSQLSKVSSNSRLSIITTDSKHTSEKMDISDDDASKSSNKEESASLFNFENKVGLGENGFLNVVQQEVNDELEAIRLEINGDFKSKLEETEEINEIKEEKQIKEEISEKTEEKMEIQIKVEEEKEENVSMVEETIDKPEIKPETNDDQPPEPPERQVEEPDDLENKEKLEKLEKIENPEKTDEPITTDNQPKQEQKKSEKSERHRNDSERRKDKYSDKDKKSDRDKRYSGSSKSSSSSSSKDKDKNREKSKDNRSSISSSSKTKDDKDKPKTSETTKESSKTKDKDDKSRSSSTKHSSRDRSRTESKSDSKSETKSDSRSSKDQSSSRKDPKKSDDSRTKTNSFEKSDIKKDLPDDTKPRKSDSKPKSSEEKSSSRSRDHSRSESSSKNSSRDRKSSSSRDHKDKKDPKDAKDQKKSNKRDKDDHSSSREKKDNRRSADRDSNDGSSGIGNNTSGNKEINSSSSTSNKSKTSDSSDSNSGSNSGDSGQSDSQSCQPIPEDQISLDSQTQKSPVKLQTVETEVMLPHVKIKKPKIASNIFEARKLMKVRKKLEKMEKKRLRKLELAQGIQNLDSPGIDFDSVEDTDSMDSGKLQIVENEEIETNADNTTNPGDKKNNSVVSKESWDAIEAQLSQSVNQNVDFDSYIDENNDSSSSIKIEDCQTKTKRFSEDEDCLYFNNQVSPTTQRFLKSVETFQKSSTLPIETKMAPPNLERPAKRPRKANLKYNQHIDDHEVVATNYKKINDTKTTAGVKKKPGKGRKRKIEPETNEIYSENNNKKLNNSLNVVDIAEEFDDTRNPSPCASNTSNGSNDTAPKKTNLRSKKNKKNNSVGSSDSFPLPLSPDSDISGNTIEVKNKMADEKEPAAPVKYTRASASKSQRYSSDDLYKPRPFVSGSSRRQRGMLNSTDKK